MGENDDICPTIAHGDDGTLYNGTNATKNNTTEEALEFVSDNNTTEESLEFVSDNTDNNTTIDSVAIDVTIGQKKEIIKNDTHIPTKTTITNNVNHVSGENAIDINVLLKSIQEMSSRFQSTVQQNEKFRKDLEESKKANMHHLPPQSQRRYPFL